MIEDILGKLAGGEDLTREEIAAAIDAIMQGRWQPGEIGLLLTGLRLKGETVEEIAGAAEAMRRNMTPIRANCSPLIDTCGTGGDGSNTFNISTTSALVTSAAGVPVAKHGNRAASSRSGSADVLSELGVNIEADVPLVEACLAELGICFCYARLFHPSMRHVAEVRRNLGFPTIFNLLGPLCNPARAPFQLLGVGRSEQRLRLAQALSMLGTQKAVVVCGEDGFGEVTLAGPTLVAVVQNGTVEETTWRPGDFGLPTTDYSAMQVQSPAESANLIRQVLQGQPGPCRDIVLANAAAALWTVGQVDTLPAGVQKAAEAIDTGQAADLLQRLVQRTNQP